jgi:hypothetical protein
MEKSLVLSLDDAVATQKGGALWREPNADRDRDALSAGRSRTNKAVHSGRGSTA